MRTLTKSVGEAGASVEQVARRRVKARRYSRRPCDDWMDRPYWRPYQYRYWQYYYPYGGPLF